MHSLTIRCLMALLLSPVVFCGQHLGQIPLSGQLEGQSSGEYSRLRVQLWDAGNRNAISEAHVNPVGSFEFSNAPTGIFEIRVLNWQGDTILSQSVTLPFSNILRLKVGSGSFAQARMPVSLARLQHKVPKKALNAYRHGREALTNGERETARIQLEAALRLDPQYFEAANDLGVLYLQDGRFSEAYEMFQRATTIDQGDAQAEANLAFVLLALKRFPEAEEAARSSIRADSLSSQARFLLAVSLLEQKKMPKAAMFHLSKAKDQFEPARKLWLRLAAK